MDSDNVLLGLVINGYIGMFNFEHVFRCMVVISNFLYVHFTSLKFYIKGIYIYNICIHYINIEHPGCIDLFKEHVKTIILMNFEKNLGQ